MTNLRPWLVVAAATAAVAVAGGALGLPSAALFAGLLVGIAYDCLPSPRRRGPAGDGGTACRARRPALTRPARPALDLPPAATRLAQALIGVTLGATVDTSTLSAVGSDWLPVLLVTAGTLALSLAAGVVMARLTGVDRPTASLGLIAGGASGIVAMADELGADGRLVAFMQYLRVLVVVLIAPVLAHVVLHHGGPAGAVPADHAGVAAGLAFTAGCTALGLLAARATGLTAGSLLLPLIIAAAASISGLAGGASVPSLVEEVAFAAIGLQVGLRFTVATIRHAGRLLPATLASIVALIAACAGLAVVLARLGGVSFADAYLATTPGGIYAVLAAAAGAGANTTFVVAVQALRVFVMVLAAPPLVRAITRERGRAGDP